MQVYWSKYSFHPWRQVWRSPKWHFRDNLLLLLSLSSWLFMAVGLLLLGMWRVSNLGFSMEHDDLIILGLLGSLEELDILEWPLWCFLFNLYDLLCLVSVSLGLWETSLFVGELRDRRGKCHTCCNYHLLI